MGQTVVPEGEQFFVFLVCLVSMPECCFKMVDTSESGMKKIMGPPGHLALILSLNLIDSLGHFCFRTTIVVTTHYIEEARQAHKVGMMRHGRMLAEGHPDALLERYL
jgi:hypothetical protein